ncbi:MULTISPECIES: hypothetical protein [Pseudomonas syringae group]|uniref:Uncharacterized protein n=3 Tax=Pseudomonas TaxID=286 RepID=A0AAJ4E4L0_PSESX|nr:MULTISPECIES: hypothetical protein [Pseudomonas syringae group]ARD12423.1 hypothetical protein PSA3335_15925 [Pseudomonas savastanoi pv. savastanoi NCPPB 3335]KWS07446.1 hypothetical protein AL064_18715 [Pseudomonas syringae pv. syringae]MBA4702928.1 hypothetical protein [Pseudomonas savastanoi pv. savastanoi]PBP53466.1 hypothetical protein CCL18_22080 [Pseudomonas syringae]PHN79887.1 hypothetical protein AO071_04955 [Pseudomonas syringae]
MTGITLKTADERVLVDMTMKLSQTMGSVDTNGVNGAVTIPAPPPGKTAYFIPVPLVDLQREKGKRPGITLSGTSLSWAYSYNTNGWGYFSANCRIYYGYY